MRIHTRVVGRSIEGEAIRAHLRAGGSKTTILVFGGFHGDEPKSVFVARRLLALFGADATAGRNASWVIVPVVNPDGYLRRRRRNARGVDINRNFPTFNWRRTSPRSRMFGGESPGSEPEAKAVIRLVERFAPSLIVTVHSISENRYCNNYDGPGRAPAEAMGQRNGYPVRATIGYPTPGSFGTWAGAERGIATITLELPSHHSSKRCWEDNREALLSCSGQPPG